MYTHVYSCVFFAPVTVDFCSTERAEDTGVVALVETGRCTALKAKEGTAALD